MMINFYEYQKIGSTILQQHVLQPVSDLSYWTSESIRNVFAAKLPLYFSKQMNLCTWEDSWTNNNRNTRLLLSV